MSTQHHDHNEHHHAHPHQSRGLHKDWRAGVVVGLMLAAMAAYVLSDDEELQPGGGIEPAMPAAAE